MRPTPQGGLPNLDVAGPAEVAIKGQRFLDSSASHHLEAHRVDERVLMFVVSLQPIPCLLMNIGIGLDDRDPARMAKGGGHVDGGTMMLPPAHEGPCLAEHTHGRQQRTGIGAPETPGSLVVLFARSKEGDEETGVDESHDAGPSCPY